MSNAHWQSSLTRTALAAALLSAFTATAADFALSAARADSPPRLDGVADDAAWAGAKATTVPLFAGRGFKGGLTAVTLKAVYSGDTLYMLVQYDDPTESLRRAPFVKQADGSWLKIKDPDDKGGDNNLYYEDKWAMIWNVAGSIAGFDKSGCSAMCHAGEKGKPYGNKYTANAGEIGDIWHMKGVRTLPAGQVDDQYLDHTRFDAEKSPEAGRKSDPKAGGGYADVKLVNGKPAFMPGDAKLANKGGTYFLKDSDKVAFDDSKFVAGDELPSMLVSAFTGDRGDISVAGRWEKGKYTFEVARKLVTGSKFDVQFDKLDAPYHFGIAAFDNAQVRHAWHAGAIELRFAR